MEELDKIIDASREQKYQQNKFAAALKGIDIDAQDDAKSKFEEVSRRAEAKLNGKSVEESEFADFGIDFETP